jgi:hypothetical protein
MLHVFDLIMIFKIPKSRARWVSKLVWGVGFGPYPVWRYLPMNAPFF